VEDHVRLMRGVTACLLALTVFAVGAPAAAALDDGLARTPPMGWNGWYRFRCTVTERTVRETADAMVASGMAAAGYRYVNLDDCWMAADRAPDGSLAVDRVAFPSGIAALADYVHARGLLLGMYLSVGDYTCQHRAGSRGHMAQDMAALAAWGADFVKVDWCWMGPDSSARDFYAEVGDAHRSAGRPMVLSLSNYGEGGTAEWAPGMAHMWRTTHDLPRYGRPAMGGRGRWIGALNVSWINAGWGPYARPGGWNDPDILQTGLRGLSVDEGRSIFSLWSMMAAPLLAGNDIRNMDAGTLRTLTNREVIAIDQHPAGRPGTMISSRRGRDLWIRELESGDRAVLFVNRTGRPARVTADARLVFGASRRSRGRFSVRDVWAHRTRTTTGPLAATVAPHGVAMFRIHRLG
jgi:alpha-galactosidase